MTKTIKKNEEKRKPPEPKFVYTQSGKPKEIFMSYALLNRITRVCPGEEEASRISYNGPLQDAIMAVLLKPKDQEFDLERDTDGIDAETIQDMLIWAVKHITHFFTGLIRKNLAHAQETMEESQELQNQAESLKGSTIGSQS